jgi:poly(A) polymerase
MEVEKLFKLFARHGEQLFLVGGAVRDKLRGVEAKDMDFATSARPDKTIAILEAGGLKAMPLGVDFGMVATMLDGEQVEITTFRSDGPGRKPQVTWGDTIEHDLERRDFTINAMAMVRGTVIDPFGGAKHLRDGVIACPGNTAKSFKDDPLRMLRAARFVARGLGEVTPEIEFEMGRLAHLVGSLSGERVFEELNKILLSPKPSEGLLLLKRTGVLAVALPQVERMSDDPRPQGRFHHRSVFEHTLLVVDESAPVAEVRWAALFHDTGKPATRTDDDRGIHFFGHEDESARLWDEVSLPMPSAFKARVRQLIAEHLVQSKMGAKGARRLVARMGDNLPNLLELRRADILGHCPKIVPEAMAKFEELKQRLASLDVTEVTAKLPRGTGEVVAKALGLKPGPELGKVMRRLQQMVVDGELEPTADLAAVVKEMR